VAQDLLKNNLLDSVVSSEAPKKYALRRFLSDPNIRNERPLFASLLIVFAGALTAGLVASVNMARLSNTFGWVLENQKAVDELNQLEIGLVEAETGQRGFVLTGEDTYLDAYYHGLKSYEDAVLGLRPWVEKNSKYQALFSAIQQDSQVKLSELKETIDLRRRRGLSAAIEVISMDLGKRTMDLIRPKITIIKNEQNAILYDQRVQNREGVTRAILLMLSGSILATILLWVCLSLYIKNSLRRSDSQKEVRHLNLLLEKQLKELKVMNRELESFSYSISHDLRAPLRAMSGFGNILLEDYGPKIDEVGKGYLQRVISAAEKMSRLINGILELSHLSRKQAVREDVDLSGIVAHVLEDLRRVEPSRDVAVQIEPNLRVRGDSSLLTAAVENILGNAWKFTSKKDLAKIEFGKNLVGSQDVYYVKDNGAGFDMAYVEKLFGTFQRLHTETEFEGTGVGLATVRRIIQLHGGTIWAESEVEKGATFYFTLS
jgi:signal transduction histidine kinase